MRHRQLDVRPLFLVAAVVGAVAALAAAPRGDGLAAQATPTETAPTPTPVPFSQVLLASALVEAIPAGPLMVNVENVSLPPGGEAGTGVSAGPVLVRVQTGQVTVDADTAIVEQVLAPEGSLRPAAPEAGAVDGRVVTAAEQVLVPAGSEARFSNPDAVAATLLVISLTPQQAPATTTPTT